MKTIFTGFAPNLTARDALTAWRFLYLPWNWSKWRNGPFVKLAEEKLKEYFNIKHAFVFDSGRSALYIALKALGIGSSGDLSAEEADEVLVQAYTCVVVSNAILKTGAKPIYVDVDDQFNMSPDDLEKKITNKAKVLIIQHTFGRPAQLDKLLALAKQYNLKIIEDCAHSFGAKYNGQLTGTFGDIGMLSFGPDKILSCVRGGALITNNDELAAKIKNEQDKLHLPSLFKTKQHLLYNVFFFFNKPLYGWGIGKAVLYLAKKLRAISRIIYQKEKTGLPAGRHGCQAAPEPYRLANCLAKMLIDQLAEVDEVNQHRQKITAIYDKLLKIKSPCLPAGRRQGEKDCIYLRYPFLVNQPKKLHQLAKQRGIILGNWYDSVIAPADIDLAATGYMIGSCPNAELLSSQSINLPTDRHITEKDAQKVAAVINQYD